MDHFSGLCHGKCNQSWIWSILDTRKMYFVTLESQFGVQKRPISMGYGINWPFEVYLGWGTHLMDLFSGWWHAYAVKRINFRGQNFSASFFRNFPKNRENKFRENAQNRGDLENNSAKLYLVPAKIDSANDNPRKFIPLRYYTSHISMAIPLMQIYI